MEVRVRRRRSTSNYQREIRFFTRMGFIVAVSLTVLIMFKFNSGKFLLH